MLLISPVFSMENGKIADTNTRNGNSEIYVLNSDGTGQTTFAQMAQMNASVTTPPIVFVNTMGVSSSMQNVADTSPKYQFNYDGQTIDERDIGPGLPPTTREINENLPKLIEKSTFMINATDVPALKWSYGCSPTSAAMYFGYFDRVGYPNIYIGPTNGGLFPLTNAIWGASPERYGECPLSASHNGIDGLTTRGHVDDYYYSVRSLVDPYNNNWQEHAPKDCIADYMGINQYQNWQNPDGGTIFFFYSDGSPLYDYTGSETSQKRDGNHGMKLFAESRGYKVGSNYNQYILGYKGNTKGFTYDQFKSEINSGNPVLIQLSGHSMLGVGYSGTNEIIVHDTWDYNSHTMIWGGTYSGMAHLGVSVIHLLPVANFTAAPVMGDAPLGVAFTDSSKGMLITGWRWDFGDGNISTYTIPTNPFHIYPKTGIYTVKLAVTNSLGSDSLIRTNYITVGIPKPGSLEITSLPSHAQIHINGIDTGKFTNWTFDDMTPGDYDVFVTLDGYTTPKTEQVTIVTGQTVSMHFVLKKEGTPVPEFPPIYLPALAIIGFLGAVLLIRRTKEN